jgi:hypothetical protein
MVDIVLAVIEENVEGEAEGDEGRQEKGRQMAREERRACRRGASREGVEATTMAPGPGVTGQLVRSGCGCRKSRRFISIV